MIHVAGKSAYSTLWYCATILSSVKLRLSLGEADCFKSSRNETLLQQFKAFYTSKNCILFKTNFQTFYTLRRHFIFLLLQCRKFLKPVRSFTTKMDSDVRDFFSSQLITNIETLLHITTCGTWKWSEQKNTRSIQKLRNLRQRHQKARFHVTRLAFYKYWTNSRSKCEYGDCCRSINPHIRTITESISH
jgi:hypothetical protein